MDFIRQIFTVLKKSLIGWSGSDALIHAAAIAFYTTFSMAPLISFTLAISSMLAAREDVEPLILRSVEELVGPPLGSVLAESVAVYIRNSSGALPSGVAALVSLVFFLFSASLVFAQLQNSLNTMWGVVPLEPGARVSILVWLRSRLTGILAAAAISLSLLGFTVLDIARLSIPPNVLHILQVSLEDMPPFLDGLSSPIFIWIVVSLVLKTFPMAKVCWRDVWLGSGITALLFWLGNRGFDLYLRYFWQGSVYGKAGTLVVFLLWIYYSIALLLFGAKFTQVFAASMDRPVLPNRGMTLR